MKYSVASNGLSIGKSLFAPVGLGITPSSAYQAWGRLAWRIKGLFMVKLGKKYT
jgi:hypothetical protein